MIRHIVLFSAARPEDLAEVREGLCLLTQIPHALRLEVAANSKSDPLSKDIDVVVYGEFANEADLAAYRAHELYAEATRRVRPLREIRLSADYDTGEAVTGGKD